MRAVAYLEVREAKASMRDPTHCQQTGKALTGFFSENGLKMLDKHQATFLQLQNKSKKSIATKAAPNTGNMATVVNKISKSDYACTMHVIFFS